MGIHEVRYDEDMVCYISDIGVLMNSHPKPFKCSIRVRSKEHEELILQTAKAFDE